MSNSNNLTKACLCLLLVVLIIATGVARSLEAHYRKERIISELQNMPSIAEQNEKARQEFIIENNGDNNEITITVINN